MKRRTLLYTAVFFIIWTLAATENVLAGEGEEMIGKIVFQQAKPTVDRNIRKELDKLVVRLKKIGSGKALKLEGDFSAAATEDEYCKNSLFMAKEVQRYLHERHVKLEALVATRKFAASAKSEGSGVVRILLIPNSFRVEKIRYERLPGLFPGSEEQPAANNEAGKEALPIAVPVQIVKVKAKTLDELAAEKKAEEERRGAEQQLAEEVRQAEDLVARVKARAAERAKKLAEKENASTQGGEESKSP